ncbi:MAG: LemA family protein [Methanobacteriaceae archaeon]|nr:LemA family protein [Methanobacteriaceae archaeon]
MNKYVVGIALMILTFWAYASFLPEDGAEGLQAMLIFVLPILVFLLVIFIAYIIETYNKLVSFKVAVEDSWADIDVQLSLRLDLADNLVNIVKGYANHEHDTFLEVTQARSNLMNATDVNDVAKSSKELNDSLKSLFIIAEQYPNLKANDNFKQLQADFKEIELTIAKYRELYNDSVKLYNTSCESFPSSILAKLFNFKTAYFFTKTGNSVNILSGN